MRLMTFKRDGIDTPGIKVEGGVVDLGARMGVGGVREILATGRLEEANRLLTGIKQPDYGDGEVAAALPVPDPQKIFCIGVNYMNRNEEYKDGSAAPQYPSIFMRSPMSFAPDGADLWIPPESDQFDYEGEIVLVIGKPGRRIAEADAHAHIAGLTIMNEGSVRDWLRHGKFNVTQGKNFDRSGGLGPWIETDLSALDLTDMRIETRVNGEVRQADTTASMAFPFAHIIRYVSTFCTLMPGDLIATGTPTGAGARFDPPKWLKPGDVVEVSVDGVGTLRNTIAAEPA